LANCQDDDTFDAGGPSSSDAEEEFPPADMDLVALDMLEAYSQQQGWSNGAHSTFCLVSLRSSDYFKFKTYTKSRYADHVLSELASNSNEENHP